MASRLNRATSASIRKKAGRAMLRRWAKTVESEVPRHSSPVRRSATPKLMSLGWVATPSRSRSRQKSG